MHTSSPFYDIAAAYNPADCDDLRDELRRFYPDECHGECKDPAVTANYARIRRELDSWIDENPDIAVLTAKKKVYRTIAREFRPVLFRNAPFYFEAGMNGGWANANLAKNWFKQHFEDRFAAMIPPRILRRFRARLQERFNLCCGFFIDEIHHIAPTSAVLTRGFRGIYEDAQAEAVKAATRTEKLWFDAMLAGLEAVHTIQLKYADEADRILRDEADVLTPKQQQFMRQVADSARVTPWEPPRTFAEALNLSWFLREILGVTDGLAVFTLGRPDALYEPLYTADIAEGRLTPDTAFDLIARWLLISECHQDPEKTVTAYSDYEAEMPVTLGGCDRDGNTVFNDITRAVILAHRKLNLTFPKLHCRCSNNSPDEYIRLLAEDTYIGHCVHTLFNDDVSIPSLVHAGKTLEDARMHCCNGCWDTGCESRENRYGANYYSLARVLEAMIYHDPELNRRVDFNFPALDELTSYDDVRKTVLDTIGQFAAALLDDRTATETGAAAAYPHPLYSACLEGCIRSHRDETAGGAKYSITDIDMAFMGNVVDSLLAIRTLCFDRKLCTLPELLDCVRNNWQTHPELRDAALKAPHWGDDTPDSTDLARDIQQTLLDVAQSRMNGRGGPFVLDAWVYREYRFWGEKMRALPDGRRNGDYLAQALNPSHFRTDKDLTTVLNAISRLEHTRFDSSNVNLTLEKSHTTLETVIALFRTFCALGMHMLQPNCQSREELLDAQEHPDRHAALIVKVCGFSVRFVTLSREWQNAILDRRFF